MNLNRWNSRLMSQQSSKDISWAMAAKLVKEQRISVKMACWALKESGHTREEVEYFLQELKDVQAEVNCM